jgi:hypothetical protein
MANFIEHLGLDFLMETEEDAYGLWTYIAQNGNGIAGYYGSPYINAHFGDAQLILRTDVSREKKSINLIGMDTHSSGPCVWSVLLSGMNIARKDADKLERRCVIRRKSDGGGMAVVNIVNADVLPSFDEGEEIKLQMVAFPARIDYFKNEKEYEAHLTKDDNGRKWLLADGMLMPTGLLRNHDPDNPEFEKDEDLDDYMLIRGTVKIFYDGTIAFGDEEQVAYIRTVIGTEYGDLEIVHTIDEVKEEQRGNLVAGATVYGVFTLSGDAAILEYEHGCVLDEPNDLSILRSTLAGADAERMRCVFADDAIYVCEYNNTTYTGCDAIIDRIKCVSQSGDIKRFASLATIVSVDEGETALPYGEGKRCVVVAENEETNYQTIAFADIDEDGRIFKLHTTANGRYRFRVDEKAKYKTPLDDGNPPPSVIRALLVRAWHHGVVEDILAEEDILRNIPNAKMYENNAKQMLETMPEGNEEQLVKNLFGYLFAKAIETAYSEKQHAGIFKKRLIVSYTPADAWNGEINTLLKPEQSKKIAAAMKLGEQFAKDFASLHPFGEPHNAAYNADLLSALLVVQQLGKLYEPKCMR